jgi:uncharacterized protein (DUF362 family)
VDSEYTVSMCCVTTHGFGGVFAMPLKLSVGLTPRPVRRTMHPSPDMRRIIAELNTGYRSSLPVHRTAPYRKATPNPGSSP